MFPAEDFFIAALEKRNRNHSLRTLVAENSLIDFCSTDYLGFGRSIELKEKILEELKLFPSNFTASTGSRLMRGNYRLTEELENYIAAFHNAPAALLFNSGYDANAGLFSCVTQRGDIILYDGLIHVSSRDGMRLSLSSKFSFRHNDLNHLEEKLKKYSSASKNPQRIFVAVESVYSMDGDFAPLNEIASLCEKYEAALIVDEAHATGVFGPSGEGRVVELGLADKVFAAVHTFGKGLGCHGGVVLCSRILREFLINFSHSFIYSTAIPPINIIALKCAYDLLENSNDKRHIINNLISLFKDIVNVSIIKGWLPGESPIQCLIIPGNEQVKQVAELVRQNGFDVRAVLSPAVPKGKERLRICLHAFNTVKEVETVLQIIKEMVEKINISESHIVP